MRISVIQLDVDLAEPRADRVARAAGLVREQREADLVLLPELWPQGAFAYGDWADEAETPDGPTVSAIGAAAREIGSLVHAGSIIERAGGRLYNTSVLVGPDGSIRATYRKIHRFGFSEGEAELLSPGDEVVTHETSFGVLGFATCYDLRFPEMFRKLLDRGAEILLVPAAWPARRIAHWRLFARARAVENQMFVVAGNTTGFQREVLLGGHSVVVDPWGDAVAEAGAGEEVLTADLDTALVAKTRESFPVLPDRRL
ncbi:MAG: carbon-nitrogen family hydrolase [Carbonactinosporaceae bacterium]